MRNFRSIILYFVITLLFSINVSSNEISGAQKELLEQLSPDQRDSVLLKIQQKDNLTAEVDEVFKTKSTMIERPELRGLEEGEEACIDCIYGYDFFKYSPSTFAPTGDSPMPSDYVLGPGDYLDFTFYGTNNITGQSYVSREGEAILPLLGPVNLLGLTFEGAKKLLQEKVEKELLGTEISVSLKELRSISVYILGEAYKPGKYTVSALSTVINALFVGGGVNENGSLRNIRITRNDKTISNYDFYEFLLKGSTSSDVRLQDGDVIFIPFIDHRVKLGGAFKRTGNYEFVEGESVKDAILLAGGPNFEASGTSPIELSSINNDNFKREILYLSQDSDNVKRKLKDGDVVTLAFAQGIRSEIIKVSGEVKNPGTYSIREGDSVLDIINRAGGYTDDSYSEGAVFLRESVAKLQKESFERSASQLERMMVDAISAGDLNELPEAGLNPINNLILKLRSEEPLGRQVVNFNYLSLKTDPFVNFRVRDGDSIYIPTRPNSVAVVGEVLNSSTLAYDPSLYPEDYIERSGGFNDFADRNRVFVILPNGQSKILKRSLFSGLNNSILPGSTIVVSRDPNPFDITELTGIITPILADLATSAAAIAAITDD